jgi:hypothetical protein
MGRFARRFAVVTRVTLGTGEKKGCRDDPDDIKDMMRVTAAPLASPEISQSCPQSETDARVFAIHGFA